MSICKICGKEVKKFGMGGHVRMAHTEEGKALGEYARTFIDRSAPAWNKGLTKETDQRVMNNSIALMGHTVSEKTRQKHSIRAKASGLGGYTRGGGRGKKGWYKGFWCDSSWELAWVVYQLDHGVVFYRNTQRFPYTFEGNKKNYIPDFLLENGSYVEIKGYRTLQVEEKIKSFPHDLDIIDSERIKPILDYVKNKYGNNFISLYEEDRSDGH